MSARIPVYQRGCLAGWATVDDADYDDLIQFCWRLKESRKEGTGYARSWARDENGECPYMHRRLFDLRAGDSREVDHVNGDGLDNRRENLRVVTHAQNQQNRRITGNRGAKSPHRGVHPCKQTGRWSAQVTLNGRAHWLGRFDTEEEAAQAAADFRSEHMPYAVESEVACP